MTAQEIIKEMRIMSNSEKEKLAPCPFCGQYPRIITKDVEPQGDPWYGSKYELFVICDCGACLFDGYFHEGFGKNGETEAAIAWNRRAAPDAAELSKPLVYTATQLAAA